MKPFHPVIRLPAACPVFDFTQGDQVDPNVSLTRGFGIGRYDERRPGMYVTPLFGGIREIHMGVDLFAAVGTEVHAFDDGEIHLFGNNSAAGDYGYTLVTRHHFEGKQLYALHGHLSARSIQGKSVGQVIRRGEIIAWLGNRTENGGWPSHLHFQLSYEDPKVPDMPGVVCLEDRVASLKKFPDPRLVLGPIY